LYYSALKNNKGFTLVELSIVIVLIGLIIAGVVGGQSLIQQGKIRSQISEFQKYQVAFNTFRLEYNAVPGDLDRASQYWSGVLNGDGNRRITGDADMAHGAREQIRFFEHLSRAGLIPGNFTRVWEMNTGYPELKMVSGKGMIAASFVRGSGDLDDHQLSVAEGTRLYTAALFLNVANPQLAGSSYNQGPGIASPVTFHSIDTKIDDGIAVQGTFKSYRPWRYTVNDCLTGIDGDYLLSNDEIACMAMYVLAK